MGMLSIVRAIPSPPERSAKTTPAPRARSVSSVTAASSRRVAPLHRHLRVLCWLAILWRVLRCRRSGVSHSGRQAWGPLARRCANACCLALETMTAGPKHPHATHAVVQPDGDKPYIYRIGDHGPNQSG